MQVKYTLFLLSFLLASSYWSQVFIRGLSFWNEPTLDIYKIDNEFSQQKTWIQSVNLDSMGIFNAQLNLTAISKLQICDNKRCSMLYAQPNGRYLIELPAPTNDSFYSQNEQDLELLFYQLDTTDINYRILGFEAWMDNYIADIYQLKDIRSNEFILKVLAFKAETAMVYGEETNAFLRDYIKYSVGLTIDNFSVIGGPTKQDKYNFYLQTDSVDYKQPKLIEYATLFYEHYDSQVDQNIRKGISLALEANDLEALVKTLVQDPLIYNTAWAEFVATKLILEYEHAQLIANELAISLLRRLSVSAQQQELREAANYFWLEKSKLNNGKNWNREYVENELGLKLTKEKFIYLHHYIPGNQKCIAEMAALKRLAERYQSKLQIISIIPSEMTWTNADNKAFEGANWQRIELATNHDIWQQLSWKSAPAYMLLDPQLKVLYLNALGPLPNARTQTIDLVLNQLFNN